MMNYEMFKETVGKLFMDYLPEQYKGMQLCINPVNKVNRVMDGITLRKAGSSISPTIYVNDMYEHFLRCNDLSKVLQVAAGNMEKAMSEMTDIPAIRLASAKDNIVFQFVNTKQNKSLLAGVPHREFLDLSIIYRWVVKIDPAGIQNTIVSNSLAEKMGMSEEQLYKAAVTNTHRILPPTVKSMTEIIGTMMGDDLGPSAIPDCAEMWVISNERGINGAISMLYEENLHDLAMKLDSDLYLIPSSVHEIIAVSTSAYNPHDLAQMVTEINMDQVALEERLSNNVYYYDMHLRKISIANEEH